MRTDGCPHNSPRHYRLWFRLAGLIALAVPGLLLAVTGFTSLPIHRFKPRNFRARIAGFEKVLFDSDSVNGAFTKRPTLFRSVREPVIVGRDSKNHYSLKPTIELVFGQLRKWGKNGEGQSRSNRREMASAFMAVSKVDGISTANSWWCKSVSRLIENNFDLSRRDVAVVHKRDVHRFLSEVNLRSARRNIGSFRNVQSAFSGFSCTLGRLSSFLGRIGLFPGSYGEIVGIPSLVGQVRQLLLIEADQFIGLSSGTLNLFELTAHDVELTMINIKSTEANQPKPNLAPQCGVVNPVNIFRKALSVCWILVGVIVAVLSQYALLYRGWERLGWWRIFGVPGWGLAAWLMWHGANLISKIY